MLNRFGNIWKKSLSNIYNKWHIQIKLLIITPKPFPLSSETLLKLGKCCGNKCMNCPYEPKHTIGNENIHNNYKSQITAR